MNQDVQYEINGLRLIHEVRDETSQPISHSHNEIELLLLEDGWGTWLLSGEVITRRPGRLVAFWAVRPGGDVGSLLADIARTEHPIDAVYVERREYGPFIGRPTKLVDGASSVPVRF